MDIELKQYLDKQFREVRDKLKEHDIRFIKIETQYIGIRSELSEHNAQFRKIDERFDVLIEVVNAGTEAMASVSREVERIKSGVREKLGVDV